MSFTETDLQQFLKNPAVKIADNSITKNVGAGPDALKMGVQLVNTPVSAPSPKRGIPNKTESEYGRLLQLEFPGSRVVFEALTLHMANGHRYTPDWVVMAPEGVLCVEVKAVGKNGYKHPSYQRAKVAFDQCRVEFPWFRWRWAEKVNGVWEVKTYAL